MAETFGHVRLQLDNCMERHIDRRKHPDFPAIRNVPAHVAEEISL